MHNPQEGKALFCENVHFQSKVYGHPLISRSAP
jgi:hypothetical protein